MIALDLLSGFRVIRDPFRVWEDNPNILVTGACGSLGSSLMKQLRKMPYKRLVGIDNNEYEVSKAHPDIYLGDCTIFLEYMKTVDIIFHASAYKHVRLGKRCLEAMKHNNVHKTRQLCKLALSVNPKVKIVLASTDKAAGKSYMGKTKKWAEEIVTDYDGVALRMVNLVRSRGSVIDIWQDFAKDYLPIPVSDGKITRYWMQQDDAVKAMIYAASLPSGVYTVYDMPQISLADMAEAFLETHKPTDSVHIPLGDEEALEEGLFNPQTEKLEETDVSWLRKVVRK